MTAPAAADQATTQRLLGELAPYRGRIALGLGLLLIAAPAGLFHPLVWMFVVDEVLMGGRWSMLVPALGAMVVVHGVFAILVGAWRDRVFERVGLEFTRQLRNRVHARISRQSVAWLHRQRTGDLQSRVISDVDQLQGSLIGGVSAVLQELVSFAFVFAAIWVLEWRIALATLGPLVVVYGIVRAFNRRMKAIYGAARERLGQLGARLQDQLGGFLVVRSFAQEPREDARFRADNDRYTAKSLEAVRLRTVVFPLAFFVGFATNVVMLGLGAWLVYRGEFTLGGLIALRGYWWQLNSPIRTLAQANDVLQRARAAASRIYAVLDAPVELVDAPDARPLVRPRTALEFRQVSFSYETGRPVLQGLSFTVQPGERLALAGTSGAGKSTVLALLARFYDPTAGAVLWGGVPLPALRQESWRPHLALVLQDTYLFHGTVRENLAYGRPDATEAEVIAAARSANAHDFIAAFPQGYDSLVGERGVKLSGGQRQRIGVARAFLANPEVLLLDEPTSSVEPESEEIIQQSLERLMEGRTVVLTSHRPSLLARADRVLVLDRGRIVEEGAPTELLVREGLFARMYRAWQDPLRTS
jgi:ABC-type multidrug transport system fused ATPase/permease subunit